MFFNIILITNSSNQPYFLIWKCLSALFKHIRMSDVKSIKNSISINSKNLLLCLLTHQIIYDDIPLNYINKTHVPIYKLSQNVIILIKNITFFCYLLFSMVTSSSFCSLFSSSNLLLLLFFFYITIFIRFFLKLLKFYLQIPFLAIFIMLKSMFLLIIACFSFSKLHLSLTSLSPTSFLHIL